MAERYWEGRWRDEAAENDRLRAAMTPLDKRLEMMRLLQELRQDSEKPGETILRALLCLAARRTATD
jgi:hypothetical protein